MIEFGLVILPLIAVSFFIIDVCWLFFAQGSLQHAVQMGVRAAVTDYVPTVNGKIPPQDSYIKSVVQTNAMGFLAGQTGLNAITICYYTPSNLNQCLSGPGSNVGGNVVEISVKNVPVDILGSFFGDVSPTLLLHAISSDVMESTPLGGAPTP